MVASCQSFQRVGQSLIAGVQTSRIHSIATGKHMNTKCKFECIVGILLQTLSHSTQRSACFIFLQHPCTSLPIAPLLPPLIAPPLIASLNCPSFLGEGQLPLLAHAGYATVYLISLCQPVASSYSERRLVALL